MYNKGTFIGDSEEWFSKLCDIKLEKNTIDYIIKNYLDRVPNKKNFIKLVEIIKNNSEFPKELELFVDNIQEGVYKKEFRYTYSKHYAKYAKYFYEVSQVSELFSLMKQALTYYNR